MKHIKFITILFIISLSFTAKAIDHEAKYVWINNDGKGIQSYLYFRNEITISSSDIEAKINLYSFSRYVLYVNEKYINFGPARSYPQHPYYDTYDITPYLKAGKNVIAVKVMNNYIETFQLPSYTGGFISWGGIKENGQTIATFATPGNWICRQATGYMSATPRFSFAKAGVEVFDARKEPDNWNNPDIITGIWQKPVILKNQNTFGELIPRTIPNLTQDEFISKYALKKITFKNEQVYNYHQVQFDTLHLRTRQPPVGYYLYTWIYSPKTQTVKGALTRGDYNLNGKKISNGEIISDFRTEYDMQLNEGWNYFAGMITCIFGSGDFLFSPENNASIFLSAEKKHDGRETLSVSALHQLVNGDAEKTEFFTSPVKAKKLVRAWTISDARNEVNIPSKTVFWKQVASVDSLPYYKVDNITLSGTDEQAVIYDMGRMTLGRFFIESDAPKGAVFDITFCEDLNNKGLLTLYKRNQINAGMRFISDGKTKRFESFKPYGARYLQVTVSGQSGDVNLKNVGMVSQIYPYVKKGSFECSDPLMNAIWELGWRTIQVCSEDSYTDTPFRERGHYAGDLFPEYAITAVTSGDTRLLKHTIRVIADQNENAYKHEEEAPQADYPLFNFMIATWYIRQYHDLEFAREIYPVYSSYMDHYWSDLRNSDGLFHPTRTFFEWTQIDKNAALTGFQAMMVAGYNDLAVLSEMLGKTGKERYKSYADTLTVSINKKLWNSQKNIYYDGYNENGYLTTAYPNSSAFPMIWDVADDKKADLAMKYLEESYLNPGPPVNRRQLSSPYGGFYALATLYKYGKANVAEQYIRKHWGKMIFESDDTAWEDFNRDNHSTMSHAWSASPTYYLSTQVLGVDLGFPSGLSADTIYIRPQSETITWAKGHVPHPKGLVWVEWKKEGEYLFVNYEAPKGIPVLVQPKGMLSNLAIKINEMK